MVFVDPNLVTFLHSFDIVAKQHVSVSASVACVCECIYIYIYSNRDKHRIIGTTNPSITTVKKLS